MEVEARQNGNVWCPPRLVESAPGVEAGPRRLCQRLDISRGFPKFPLFCISQLDLERKRDLRIIEV